MGFKQRILQGVGSWLMVFLMIGVAGMVGGDGVMAAGGGFLDVDSDEVHSEAIDFLRVNKIVNGYPDGTFRPEAKISRYEFTKIIVGSTVNSEEIGKCDRSLFADVPEDQWFSPYVCVAKEKGIIQGYVDGEFKGTRNIQLAEALKIVISSYEIEPGPEGEQWYSKYISKAEELDLMKNFLDKKPDHLLSRAEMSEIILQTETRDFQGIRDQIQEIVDQRLLPGVSVGIVKDDKVVFSEGFGLRDIQRDLPATASTLYNIASTHKALTSMYLATFVDQGHLGWDQPIVEVFKNFKLANSARSDQITIRHLLSMTSGISEAAEDDYFDLTAGQLLSSLSEVDVTAAVGEKFQYSNLSVSAAAYIAGKAIDPDQDPYMVYSQEFYKRILGPIGMTDSTLSISEAQASPNFAVSYEYDDRKDEYVRVEISDKDNDALSPSGGLKSNVLDMSQFLITELNGGRSPIGNQVVTEENIEERWKPVISNEDTYGMGWEETVFKGVKGYFHEGSFDNYDSIIVIIPSKKIGYVILTNTSTEDELFEEIGQSIVSLLW